MRAAAPNGAFSSSCRFRLKKGGVEIGKVFELQARDFSSDEVLDGLQCRNFFAVHKREGVADILRAAGAADPVHVILGMLGHVVVDNVADAGDVEAACGDIGGDHDFVFAALESFERFNTFALGAVGVQNRYGMVSLF